MIISIKEIKNFIISVLIPLLVGYASSFLSQIISKVDTSTYYSQLIKPSFAPPSYVFPIAWSIIFVLMGISYYIINKNNDNQKIKDALFYYYLQLALNFVWSILFFGLDLRFTSMVDIILLLGVVIIMMLKFYKIDKRALYLNILYVLWLLYAGVLNYFIWIINR